MITPDWEKMIPADFSESAKVWIFQNNRPFSAEEQQETGRHLRDFVGNWVSHGKPVNGWGTILFNQFILLIADDKMEKICGSAVDNSVRFIEGLEKKFGLDLMNRMNLGFIQNGELLIIPFNEVEQNMDNNTISPDTLFFNNAISTKNELLSNWIQPVEKSFLWKRFSKV